MSNSTALWPFENNQLFNMLHLSITKVNDNRHEFRIYQKNQFIYFPGEAAIDIFMIAKGRIRIGHCLDDGKEVTKAILTAGEIFGELAIAGVERRNDFAQVMENNTSVCAVSIHELKSWMVHDRELSFHMLKLIGLRLMRVERKLELLTFKDARTRIIEFLRDAACKGKKIGFETMIPAKLTHKDIAALTGTSRQTATTILNDLKDKNLIYFDRRKILIRDMDKLA